MIAHYRRRLTSAFAAAECSLDPALLDRYIKAWPALFDDANARRLQAAVHRVLAVKVYGYELPDFIAARANDKRRRR